MDLKYMPWIKSFSFQFRFTKLTNHVLLLLATFWVVLYKIMHEIILHRGEFTIMLFAPVDKWAMTSFPVVETLS